MYLVWLVDLFSDDQTISTSLVHQVGLKRIIVLALRAIVRRSSIMTVAFDAQINGGFHFSRRLG